MEWGIAIFILTMVLIIFFTAGVLSYVFYSVGLYKIGKKEEESSYPFAWIPYLNQYLLGKIAFKSKVQAIIMLIINILDMLLYTYAIFICKDIYVLRILSIAIFVVSFIVSIYSFIARYKIYNKYSKSTIIMLVIDILSFGLLGPIFIFAIRNNEKK